MATPARYGKGTENKFLITGVVQSANKKVEKMSYSEIYCFNCKKVLGRYNSKYYTDDKVGEMLRYSHASHIRDGHQVKIRKVNSQ